VSVHSTQRRAAAGEAGAAIEPSRHTGPHRRGSFVSAATRYDEVHCPVGERLDDLEARARQRAAEAPVPACGRSASGSISSRRAGSR